MEPPRAVEPLGLFTYAALTAGWYFCWRMFVFTAPFWLGAGLVAALLVYLERELEIVAAVLAVAGFLAAFIASIPLTTRIARAWGFSRYSRAIGSGVWWGIFWRVTVVSFVAGLVFAAAQVGTALYALTLPVSPMRTFVLLTPYAVAIANIVVTLRAYGWAMSIMVARRLAGSAPRPAVTLATAATATGPRPTCPKCGSRDTERGAVIGWYCRVCGWRESRR